MTLAQRIEQAVTYRAIKQNEAERRCGWPPGTLAQLKARPRPPLEKIFKLAAVLGVDSQWLKSGAGSPDYEEPWREKTFARGEEIQGVQAVAPVREPRVVTDERYPNRDAAVAIYEGVAPTSVIKAVLSLSFKSNEDRPYEEWCKVIEKLIADRRRVEAGESIVGGEKLDLTILD